MEQDQRTYSDESDSTAPSTADIASTQASQAESGTPDAATQYPSQQRSPSQAGPDDGRTTESVTTDGGVSAAAQAGVTTPPAAEAGAGPAAATTIAEGESPLLPGADADALRQRWREIQGQFVDEPREAVHQADTLVTDVIQTLASTFAQHKKDLEAQWGQGEQVDTEDLRGALRRYRSFFNRLLST
jgi:hypothetical protein